MPASQLCTLIIYQINMENDWKDLKFRGKNNAKIPRKNYEKISRKNAKICDWSIKRFFLLRIMVEHMYCERTDRNLKRWLVKLNSLHQTFTKVKEEKLFKWHNTTSKIELSEQRILFRAIHCCSYKTHGSHIFSHISQKKSQNFASFSLHLFSQKTAKFRKKSLWNATENFRLFSAKRFLRWKPYTWLTCFSRYGTWLEIKSQVYLVDKFL